jgi:hypothetical protein
MKNVLLFSILGLLVAGCSVQGEITDIETELPKVRIFDKTAVTEVNSGARGLLLTNDNYKVGYSIGNMNGKLQSKTSSGYQVFMTVQGSVFSEEQQQ